LIARVLLVGDELLGGTIHDRNVAQVARAFGPRGVPVVGVEVVGDVPEAIAAAAHRAAEHADVLVVTGGLGPTADDVTRDGLALALGVGLDEDESVRADIEARMERRGIERPADSVRRQATFPVGTAVVRNPVGSAPGFSGWLGKCRFFVLPGVPQEVAEMLPAVVDVLPDPPPGRDWQRLVATAGRGEVRVAETLEGAGFVPPPGISLAYLPSPGGVRLRLFAPSGAPVEDLDRAEQEIRKLLADWALPRESVQDSLVERLREKDATLTTAESCTGGLLGARITDVPGASSVYLGGIVAYSNAVKISRLGVDVALLEEHGAVSGPVASAMARGARDGLGSDLAVSVTGIAGPGGGTPEKPVGTVWIGVADRRGDQAHRFLFGGSREMVRERTVNKALEIAYRRAVAGDAGA
jgi:nicotinamide-nucleotide amidase